MIFALSGRQEIRLVKGIFLWLGGYLLKRVDPFVAGVSL